MVENDAPSPFEGTNHEVEERPALTRVHHIETRSFGRAHHEQSLHAHDRFEQILKASSSAHETSHLVRAAGQFGGVMGAHVETPAPTTTSCVVRRLVVMFIAG